MVVQCKRYIITAEDLHTSLWSRFSAENILVDLRLHDKGTMARNHGTGFRTYENKLSLLFNNVKDL